MSWHIDEVPPGDWFCPTCGSMIKDDKVDQRKEGNKPTIYRDFVTTLHCGVCGLEAEIREIKVAKDGQYA